MTVFVVTAAVHDIPIVRRQTILVVRAVTGVIEVRQTDYVTELMAKRSDQMGKGIVYTVMVETYAIFAFVVSILIWSNIAI